ncbi:MAG TPA: ABC transporter ATP-binding protein [Spirochaetia bacterium]|nr:ABC transporter ATP-binding protein [Spirochaetia bacterium]
METAIRVEKLSRQFGPLRAVAEMSFEVPRGTIFGFLGPNGAGKSTTIRLLLGLLLPSAGRAEVLGCDCSREGENIRQHTGVVFHNDGLYDRLTAEQNLAFYARVAHLTEGEGKRRVGELLTRAGLAGRAREPVRRFSRGMRQKLALARALLSSPSVLFLDEPSSGLDPAASASLHADLLDLAEEKGVTIFLTTHNLSEEQKLCHQIAVIRDGRIVAAGNPNKLMEEMIQSPGVRIFGHFGDGDFPALLADFPGVAGMEKGEDNLHLTLEAGASISDILKFVLASGAEITEVIRDRGSLEEVYLALMEEEENDRF